MIVCGHFNAICGNLTDCPIGDTVKNWIVIFFYFYFFIIVARTHK